ncbi:hypothetical protein [Cryptosporangium sp. NPDC048952]|uniref:hypothetical protein n=1 Tax=Cryptosporangium sp. NPDC048952 TaxID=3363961 RepID=UPI00371208A4
MRSRSGRRRRVVGGLLAGLAGVVAVVVVAVVLVRPEGTDGTVRAEPSAPERVIRGTGTAPDPAGGAAPTPAAPTPTAPAPTAPTAATPAASTTPSAQKPATRTRIVSPANGSRVSWPFTARFTVSTADSSVNAPVLALSICVAGRCYLDGALNVTNGTAAPYTVRLGATKPEGVGVPWTLRLDRLSPSTYARLVSERNAAIADSRPSPGRL